MKIDFTKKDEQITNAQTGWFFTILTVMFAILRFTQNPAANEHGLFGMNTWSLVGFMCGLIAVVTAVRARNLGMGVIALVAVIAPSIAHVMGLI